MLQYTLIIHLTKFSILYFYLQFFPFVVFPKLRTTIYVTMAATLASGLAFTMAVVFQCTPISAAWNGFDEFTPASEMASAHCINVNVYGFTGASINLAFDLWLMLLPMPELIKLTLPLRKKIAVCLMFAVGSL
jgi:branched-subunit amino acid transport protein AzlD